MKYFEFTVLYGPKKKPVQFSGNAFAKDLSECMKRIESHLFLITGKWQTIREGLLTEITDENYFSLPNI